MRAPRPMGPAPKTTARSPETGFARFTAWRATAMGSLSAATSQGMCAGTMATLRPSSALSIST